MRASSVHRARGPRKPNTSAIRILMVIEDSTRKLVIVNVPPREHMTMVQLLVELVNKLV